MIEPVIRKVKAEVGMMSMVGVFGEEYPFSFGNYFSFAPEESGVDIHEVIAATHSLRCINMWAENLDELVKRTGIKEVEVAEFDVTEDGKKPCAVLLVIDEHLPSLDWLIPMTSYTGKGWEPPPPPTPGLCYTGYGRPACHEDINCWYDAWRKTRRNASDPVRYYNAEALAEAEDKDLNGLTKPGWYFWDEIWASAYGPYTTEEFARKALEEYADHLHREERKLMSENKRRVGRRPKGNEYAARKEMTRYVPNVTLEDIRTDDPEMIFYSIHGPWWTHDPEDLHSTDPADGPKGKITSGGEEVDVSKLVLPCDPLGGVLMQTDKFEDFLVAAERKPKHYGRHGLRAFMAAHAKNCRGVNNKLMALMTWDEYNDLLDTFDARTEETEKDA